MFSGKPAPAMLGLAGLLVIAAPAVAQEKTTLQYVIANGATVTANVAGQSVGVSRSYKDDGTYTGSAAGQSSHGKWRIDGDKLCHTPDASGRETCIAYPAGKKPGDEFKVQNPQAGEITIKINP